MIRKRGASLLFFVVCSMSHAEQLPEQPAAECVSEQPAPPSASRVSCTAHLMPSRACSCWSRFLNDVVTLDHQRKGHAQYEQPDGKDGTKQDD